MVSLVLCRLVQSPIVFQGLPHWLNYQALEQGCFCARYKFERSLDLHLCVEDTRTTGRRVDRVLRWSSKEICTLILHRLYLATSLTRLLLEWIQKSLVCLNNEGTNDRR